LKQLRKMQFNNSSPYIYIYISKGYASCRRPLDADWGLVISRPAAQLET
jgi:hypothetical protein